MPIINRLADYQDELVAIRRDLHQHPELVFDCHRTAAVVARSLQAFGVDEVVTGIGRTGVVGVIHGRETSSGRVIGLRADMDALPMTETTGKPYASANAGAMHACGHDGHTTMLLGAARYLAETRQFNGTVAVIFQPAEEDDGGAAEMIADGLMERFKIDEIYGLHNAPGLPPGYFATRPGSIMAGADTFEITVTGKGGHAAQPYACIDPIVVGAQIVTALQAVVSRMTDPIDPVVLSVTQFHSGTVSNVIPQTAKLGGTIRAFSQASYDKAIAALEQISRQTAAAYGAQVQISRSLFYPPVVNHAAQTALTTAVAAELAGAEAVHGEMPPLMGSEDFAYMLQERPGAFMFIGNGNSAGLHNTSYDFNDEIIPVGASYWAKLAETAMPIG